MSETPERRQAKRIAIRLPVVYRGPDGAARHGTTENVSRRGMLIAVAQPQAEGTRLRVAVTGADGRERELVGEVVRTTSEGKVAVELAEHDAPAIGEILGTGTETTPPAT